MTDIEILRAAAEYLKDRPKVVFTPYPNYNERVIAALDTLPSDHEYLSHYEKLKDKAIRSMTLDDLATMYTFILRGERFCDGHIVSFIEDGRLLELVDRHIELLEKEKARRLPFFSR